MGSFGGELKRGLESDTTAIVSYVTRVCADEL